MVEILRWVARVWSAFSMLIILPFVFGGQESMRATTNEMVALLFFPTGVLIGFAIAWWKESIGGLISLFSLGLFYQWIFALSGRVPGRPYFVLFSAPAFLFLGTAFLSQRGRHGLSGTAPEVRAVT